MYLTDERLVFVSHRINRFVHTWEVPLQAIARVELGLTMHLIPNGLRIFTTEGEHQFVVSGRGHWKRFITEAVHRRLTSHSGESVPAGPN